MPHCDRCGRDAAFRVSEAGVERWACPACLDASLGEANVAEVASAMTRVTRTYGKCPHCGTSAADAVESGLVGCPLCYVSLGQEVWNALDIRQGQWSRMDVW